MDTTILKKNYSVIFQSNKSKQLYNNKCHALLGISPFNSYFTEVNITNLISWADENFLSYNIFLPSNLSKFTLLGLGYDEKRAQKKTLRQDQYLYNKIIRSFSNVGIDNKQGKSKIITTDTLLSNPAYLKLLNFYKNLYTLNESFRNLCHKASTHAMQAHVKDQPLSETKIALASQYILHEIPLFLNTPTILGVSPSLFVYHQIPNFINDLYYNYTQLSSDKQGFIGASVENEVECIKSA